MSHRIIEILRPRFEWVRLQAEAFRNVPHATIKGHLREELVQNLVEPYLPPMVKVVSGTIVSTAGDRTHRNQDDLVIFDRERAPLLLDMKECVIPIEGVLAQVEIKSILTRAEMKAAVLAAAELRDLASDQAPCGLVFAYQSDLTEQSEVDRMLAVMEEVGFHAKAKQATSPIQAICVASRGTWLLLKAGGREGWWYVNTEGDHHLFAFASVISNSVYTQKGARGGVGNYLLDTAWLKGPVRECPLVVPG